MTMGWDENGGKILFCNECCEEFVWEVGEQVFYAVRGFPPPKRCPACRLKMKQKREEAEERIKAEREAWDEPL